MCPGFTSPGIFNFSKLILTYIYIIRRISTNSNCRGTTSGNKFEAVYTYKLYNIAMKAIYAEGKKHAVAVGLTKMSTNDMLVSSHIVFNVLYFADKLLIKE